MTAFTTSAFVFWKTTFYLALNLIPKLFGNYFEIFLYIFSIGGQHFIASGIPFWKELAIFWLPNSVWIFVPLFSMMLPIRQIISEWKLGMGGKEFEGKELEIIWKKSG